MSDTAKREAVLEEFRIDRQAAIAPGVTRITAGHDGLAMADEIVRLRAENAALKSAVERVRVLHTPEIVGDTCPSGCQGTDALIEARVGEWEWPPCPTLRALEVGRE